MNALLELSELPSDWKVLPFLDVFYDATSKGIKVKKENYDPEGKLPVVDQGKKMFGGFTGIENKVDIKLPVIVFGDHTKIFKLIDTEFAVGADGVKLLEPKIEADKKFLYFYLNQLQLEDAGYSRHFKFLKETYILLPPLDTQKKIAAVLEKADQLCKDCQQMEQELNSLAQSVFVDMFGDPVTNPKGWDVKLLKDLVSILSGATPSKSNDKFWVGDVPWVSPKDMKVPELYDSIDHVSDVAFTETNLKSIPLDSILIVVRGMILVHTVPLAITRKELAINQDIKALTVNCNSITSEFLFAALSSMQTHLLSLVSTAAHGTKRIDMADLLSLSIVIPSIEQQLKFIEVVTTIRKMVATQKAEATLHRNNFNAIIQQAFKGKLNLTDAPY